MEPKWLGPQASYNDWVDHVDTGNNRLWPVSCPGSRRCSGSQSDKAALVEAKDKAALAAIETDSMKVKLDSYEAKISAYEAKISAYQSVIQQIRDYSERQEPDSNDSGSEFIER